MMAAGSRSGSAALSVLVVVIVAVGCGGEQDPAAPPGSDAGESAAAESDAGEADAGTAAADDDQPPVVDDDPPTPPTPGPDDPADLILRGGTIVTVDGSGAVPEAVAISGGRFVAIGTETDVMALAGISTRLIDLGGMTVLPGVVDPHLHLIQGQTPDLAAMVEDQRLLLENGRTTVGIPAVVPVNMDGFEAFDQAGLAVLRTHLYVSYNDACGVRAGDHWQEVEFDRSVERRIAVVGVKVFADGGVCNSPAVSWSYPDTPEALALGVTPGFGDLYVSVEEITGVVSDVDQRGGLTVIHAIGDVAIETALDGVAEFVVGPGNGNGHRLDHNVVLPPELYTRYGDLDITPVVFGPFSSCREEAGEGWALIQPADSLPWIRAASGLMAANPGMRVSFHSDVPFGPLNLFEQIHGMVTLRERDPTTGRICPAPPFLDGQGVPVDSAIEMVTINGAHAMGLESDIGSIEIGKIADLIVVATNPLEQVGDELLDNTVEATLVEGEVVWCSGGSTELCDAIGYRDLGGAAASEGDPGLDSALTTAIGSLSASSVDPGWPLEGIADGVTTDGGWVSAGAAPQWVEIDLGEEVDVSTLVLWVDQFPDGPTDHRILGGLDQNPTEEVARITDDTHWGQRLEVPIGRVVRHLRIETVSSPSTVAWLEIAVVPA